jgi:hypothetical protein
MDAQNALSVTALTESGAIDSEEPASVANRPRAMAIAWACCVIRTLAAGPPVRSGEPQECHDAAHLLQFASFPSRSLRTEDRVTITVAIAPPSSRVHHSTAAHYTTPIAPPPPHEPRRPLHGSSRAQGKRHCHFSPLGFHRSPTTLAVLHGGHCTTLLPLI